MDGDNNNPVDPNMTPAPAGEPMEAPAADPMAPAPEAPAAPAEGEGTPAV